ncbi:endocuticle structural glycoprotein SgAbd-5-like [Spodoptera litura]|uniref:Cuticular protein RR-1 n=1 Tax=Spodoptera litura TaxID=69820 RepID=A0A4U7BD75_SPOLT|nr:endocuticle structural glycoprotein SgAbd-5-like [Spodoptera litura]TKX27790.1 cuticular protein RR-1 [Spodoptera litura]
MKLIVALCLVAVAVAAPPPRSNSGNVEIVKYENDNIGLGNYKYGFELTDGTGAEQQAELRNEGKEDESIAVKGSFAWVGPDGVLYRVIYVADDNGYQPTIEQGPGGAVPPGVVASLLG